VSVYEPRKQKKLKMLGRPHSEYGSGGLGTTTRPSANAEVAGSKTNPAVIKPTLIRFFIGLSFV
jgi:hypothetical protein